MKKIFHTIALVLAMSGLVVILGFSARETERTRCHRIEIHVDQTEGNYFVTDTDVRDLILSRGDSLIGRNLANIDIDGYERVIEDHPSIRNAEVFTKLDGTLAVRVEQRNPVIRVFTAYGESFYLDEEGYIMPTSAAYTARVPVASGHILDQMDLMYGYNILELSDSLSANTILDDAFKLSQFLRADPFWNEQIDQIEVAPNQDLVLVPLVGQHHIILGSIENLEAKFNKLREFYSQGLARVGWDRYDTINLKFKDQVVCTKKPIVNGSAN